MLDNIINILKKINSAKQACNRICNRIYKGVRVVNLTSIPQVASVKIKKSRFDFERMNLLIPSINEEHLFGGISTALKLFDEIIKKTKNDIRVRIVLTDATPNKNAMSKFDSYKLVSPDDDIDTRYQLLPLGNKDARHIFVTKNDKFIATAWWTAYSAQDIIKQQSELYGQDCHKMIYIIQDFEPGFYNWSSHFVLAESTYKSVIPTIAVFNSFLLRDFFKKQDYSFYKEYFFEPQLNEHLRKGIKNTKGLRKKQIIFYGRPSVDRNCFSLIITALREWVSVQPEPGDWQLISVGEQHPSVDLGNGAVFRSVGKLSLPEYANLLAESAIGVSFMVSPHPSYPPLEMAHFGLLTLTNTYANKDLSRFHDNIVSLEQLAPVNIAARLVKMTEKFSANPNVGSHGRSHMPCYCYDSPQFPFLDELISILTQ